MEVGTRMTYRPNDRPGYGVYTCNNDDWRVTLDADNDTLHPCQFCGYAAVYRWGY